MNVCSVLARTGSVLRRLPFCFPLLLRVSPVIVCGHGLALGEVSYSCEDTGSPPPVLVFFNVFVTRATIEVALVGRFFFF